MRFKVEVRISKGLCDFCMWLAAVLSTALHQASGACLPGHYYAQEEGSCIECEAGRYGSPIEMLRSACDLCPSGKWSGAAGAHDQTTCVRCAAGRYSSKQGATSAEDCTGCPPGKFGSEEGSSHEDACTVCRTGRWHISHGQSSHAACACAPGFYYMPYSDACLECGEGVACAGGFAHDTAGEHRAPVARPGWYMIANATAVRCELTLGDRVTSVCRGGASYRETQSAGQRHGTVAARGRRLQQDLVRRLTGIPLQFNAYQYDVSGAVCSIHAPHWTPYSQGSCRGNLNFNDWWTRDGQNGYWQVDVGTVEAFRRFDLTVSRGAAFAIKYSDDNITWHVAAQQDSNCVNCDIEWGDVGSHRFWRYELIGDWETGPWYQNLQFWVLFTTTTTTTATTTTTSSTTSRTTSTTTTPTETTTTTTTNTTTTTSSTTKTITTTTTSMSTTTVTTSTTTTPTTTTTSSTSTTITYTLTSSSTMTTITTTTTGTTSTSTSSTSTTSTSTISTSTTSTSTASTSSTSTLTTTRSSTTTTTTTSTTSATDRIAMQPCMPGHRGMMCASCEDDHVRDSPSQPCWHHDRYAHSLSLFLALQADLVMKAGVGFALTYIASQAVLNTDKLDVVLIRIFAHYCMTQRVLAQIDFSQVTVFGWNQAEHRTEQTEHRDNATQSTRASSSDLTFAFPRFFSGSLKRLSFFTGSLPAVISNDDALMVLALRFNEGAEDRNSKKLMAPIVWWLIYPLLVFVWQALISVLVAKVAAWAMRREFIATPTKGRPSQDEGLTLRQLYPICGLFRDNEIGHILIDMYPMILITFYSLWSSYTLRYLVALDGKSLYVKTADEDGKEIFEQQLFWTGDYTSEFLTGTHAAIGPLACTGIGLWSVGAVLFLFVRCQAAASRHKLMDPQVKRNYGFFLTGYSPEFIWWELAVKRIELFLVYVIAYTSCIASDPKGKLIMYMGVSGCFWSAHNAVKPYDRRRASLSDRFEGLCFLTRFVTSFALCALLMSNPEPFWSVALAVLILAVNCYFVVQGLLLICGEIFGTLTCTRVPASPTRMPRYLKLAYTRAVPAAVMILRALVGQLPLARNELMAKVPHLIWHGRGRRVDIAEPHDNDMDVTFSNVAHLHRRLYRILARSLFRLGSRSQRIHAVACITDCIYHIVARAGFRAIPPNIVDIIVVMSIALRRLRQTPSGVTAPTDFAGLAAESVDQGSPAVDVDHPADAFTADMVGREIHKIFQDAERSRSEGHLLDRLSRYNKDLIDTTKAAVDPSDWPFPFARGLENDFFATTTVKAGDLDDQQHCHAEDLADATLFIKKQSPEDLRVLVANALAFSHEVATEDDVAVGIEQNGHDADPVGVKARFEATRRLCVAARENLRDLREQIRDNAFCERPIRDQESVTVLKGELRALQDAADALLQELKNDGDVLDTGSSPAASIVVDAVAASPMLPAEALPRRKKRSTAPSQQQEVCVDPAPAGYVLETVLRTRRDQNAPQGTQLHATVLAAEENDRQAIADGGKFEEEAQGKEPQEELKDGHEPQEAGLRQTARRSFRAEIAAEEEEEERSEGPRSRRWGSEPNTPIVLGSPCHMPSLGEFKEDEEAKPGDAVTDESQARLASCRFGEDKLEDASPKDRVTAKDLPEKESIDTETTKEVAEGGNAEPAMEEVTPRRWQRRSTVYESTPAKSSAHTVEEDSFSVSPSPSPSSWQDEPDEPQEMLPEDEILDEAAVELQSLGSTRAEATQEQMEVEIMDVATEDGGPFQDTATTAMPSVLVSSEPASLRDQTQQEDHREGS